MDGVPETVPDERSTRQIAFAYGFTPVEVQFYDQYIYDSGDQVFTFASGDNNIDIQFLTDGVPRPI
jgi:hypothetical protein